jgi:uncharacterized heparinase superfamily protein
MLKTYFLFFHTVRHLRAKQIAYRLYYKFFKVKVRPLTYYTQINFEHNRLGWQGMPYCSQSIFADKTASFLNKSISISASSCWNDNNQEKLWLYNLHYMDELNSIDGKKRLHIHKSHVLRWITENSAPMGCGWEPYTLSLRLVNIVKWCWSNEIDDKRIIASLAQQADVLTQQLEYHILANHLFANAKALVFIGCFFEGEVGNKYLDLGLKVLTNEIKEQFLDDGAHFELSPMYHSVILWDMLELIELSHLHSQLFDYQLIWSDVAQKGLEWLQAMCHPDGKISFFNDASMGIAAAPNTIDAYAIQLGLSLPSSLAEVTQLSHSGYTRVTKDQVSLIFNHAQIGPDYQPGHAHADSLSFELSIDSHRLFVNSGTSCYGASKKRHQERQTKSHNTLVINGRDSSEVWGGFRVAKRAKASDVDVRRHKNGVTLSAYHDGYTGIIKGLLHKRNITVGVHSVIINDILNKSCSDAIAYYYLHPEIRVKKISSKELELVTPSNVTVKVKSTFDISLEPAVWHPCFGLDLKTQAIVIKSNSTQELILEWKPCD